MKKALLVTENLNCHILMRKLAEQGCELLIVGGGHSAGVRINSEPSIELLYIFLPISTGRFDIVWTNIVKAYCAKNPDGDVIVVTENIEQAKSEASVANVVVNNFFRMTSI